MIKVMYVSLSKEDIGQILELQDVVYNSLSSDEKDFLLPKDKEKKACPNAE